MPEGGGESEPRSGDGGSEPPASAAFEAPSTNELVQAALARSSRLLEREAQALEQLEAGLGDLVASVADEDRGYPLRLTSIQRSSFPVQKADQLVRWVRSTLGARLGLRVERVLDRILFWDAVPTPRAVGEYVVWRSRFGPRKHRLVAPSHASALAGWRYADWRRSSADLLLLPAVRILSLGCPGVEALLGGHAEVLARGPEDIGSEEPVPAVDLLVVGSEALLGRNAPAVERLLLECGRRGCPAAVFVEKLHPGLDEALARAPEGTILLALDLAIVRDVSKSSGHRIVGIGPALDPPPGSPPEAIGESVLHGFRLEWLQKEGTAGHPWIGGLGTSWKVVASPAPDAVTRLAPAPEPTRASCLVFDRTVAAASSEELDLLGRAMTRRHAIFVPPQEQPLPPAFEGAPFVVLADDRECPSAFASEHELRRLGHLAWRHVATRCSRTEAIRRLTSHVGIPRLVAGLPLVSVICVSFRPERLKQCLEQYRAQTYRRKELILVANQDVLSESWVQSALAHDDVTLLRTEASQSLGASLNRARAVAEGDVWAKIDDDDHYGPNYLADQVLALRETKAAVVGKGTFFTFIEGQNQLYLTSQVREHRFSEYFVHGGTIVANRRLVEMIDFAPVVRGTDTLFLQQCRLLERPVYSTDRYNYAYFRYSGSHHTFDVPRATFLDRSEHVANEFDRTLIDT